jgi:hypothetical protein
MPCCMGATNRAANKLPDALLVRYFRAGKIEDVRAVKIAGDGVAVTVGTGAEKRIERWQDLGGGLGFVPDAGE